MLECWLTIKGIDDDKIKSTFTTVLDRFEKQGYDFDDKIERFKNGKIQLIGQGTDGRCRFCEYFRKAILEHYKKNKSKGSIEFIDCPYNSDEKIDYTSE